MPTTTPADFSDLIDACMDEKDRHVTSTDDTVAICACGWTLAKASTQAARVAAGMHRAAAEKAADRAFDRALKTRIVTR